MRSLASPIEAKARYDALAGHALADLLAGNPRYHGYPELVDVRLDLFKGICNGCAAEPHPAFGSTALTAPFRKRPGLDPEDPSYLSSLEVRSFKHLCHLARRVG